MESKQFAQLILIAIFALGLFIIPVYLLQKGVNKVVDKSNQKYEEVALLPVSPESNTLAVVCPLNAQNNPNYPDPDCINAKYYGGWGIELATKDVGQEHTVLIKKGIYNGPITIEGQGQYLRLIGEDRDETIIKGSVIFEENMGLTVENLTFTTLNPIIPVLERPLGSEAAPLVQVWYAVDATFKNNLFYGGYEGLVFNSNTISLKAYQNVFAFNAVGLNVIADNFPTTIKNNVFIGNTAAGLMLYGETSNQHHTVQNNTFYKNNIGSYVSTLSPNNKSLNITNNIYYDNTTHDLAFGKPVIAEGKVVELVNEKYGYNYSNSNNQTQFCVYKNINPFREIFSELSSSNISLCSDFTTLSSNQFGLQAIRLQTVDDNNYNYNFNLASNSQLIDLGNPSYADRDGSQSDPGVYGGDCYYDSDGCYFEFPDLKKINTLLDGNIVLPQPTNLDLNKDGFVNLGDVIWLVKYIFIK